MSLFVKSHKLSLLSKTSVLQRNSVRFAAGRWRDQNGLPPRYASPSPLADLPEFSFMDGRGPAPLSIGRKAKYLRDQMFADQIIKYNNQMKRAKELVPDSQREVLKLR